MIGQKRLAKITLVAKQRQEGILVLEDIYDPHNAAAVLRTAEAFGIQKVYFIFEKQKRFNPRKIGKVTSASANKWLDFKIFASAKDCFRHLKRQGYTIAATVLDDKAQPLSKFNFTDPKIALVFGNEHLGLSRAAMELADHHLYIPMRGFVQSLNLSVTAAICIYEMTRQRQISAKKFLFASKDQNNLIKVWKNK